MVTDNNKGPVLGVRHLQIFLLFLSIIANYFGKLNAGVAVVAMTNAETTNPSFEEFDWQEKEKAYILSSFYWGYVLTQFPGGYLCRRFGAKITMFISIFGSATVAIMIPFCLPLLEKDWEMYCILRIVQGLFQGLQFPCIHAHLAAWCPPSERNRLGALSQTGIECGTVLAMFVSGMVSASRIGWPGIFYVTGVMGFIWCTLWIIFGANCPKSSVWITNNERRYIEMSLNPKVETEQADGSDSIVRKNPVPWLAIFTSLPFWALLVARTAHAWGFSTLQAEIPSYMNGVLQMNMKKNALYSTLPYLAMWIMSYVYLIIADCLLRRKIVTLTILRKTFNSIAFWIPALGLIMIGFVGVGHKKLAVVLMTGTVGINAGTTIGSALNTIDLSPNHAGILMGIVNTAASCAPIFTPLVTAMIVTNEHDRSQWQIVFIISAAVFFFANIFFIIFGSTQLQPWNDVPSLGSQKVSVMEKGTEKVVQRTM